MAKYIVSYTNHLSKVRDGYSFVQQQVKTLAKALNAEILYGSNPTWNEEDVVFVYCENYYDEKTDKMLIYGGFHENLHKNLSKFFRPGNYKFVIRKLPNMGTEIKRRMDKAKKWTAYSGFNYEFADKLEKIISNFEIVYPENFNDYYNIGIGDSHILSSVRDGAPYHHIKGKTLYGILKGGLSNELENVLSTKREFVTFMFGSVDIRHHLFRQKCPYESLDSMLSEYVKQCQNIIIKSENNVKNIEIFCPVPIESEERIIKKSITYKGTPFYGSREDRLALTLYFIRRIKELTRPFENITVAHYPIKWYYYDPQYFEKEIMERPHNNHISYIYSRNNGFGENDVLL